ncbi:MAG: hypothetical protein ACN6N0_18335, partial [Microvirgula sp.]
ALLAGYDTPQALARVLRETVDASASVAARDRLDLGVHTLVNREHALLFSAGDLAIGGALGSDGRATGTADHVGNHSASIEALNGLSLNAN